MAADQPASAELRTTVEQAIWAALAEQDATVAVIRNDGSWDHADMDAVVDTVAVAIEQAQRPGPRDPNSEVGMPGGGFSPSAEVEWQ